jgi:hypothetical protein
VFSSRSLSLSLQRFLSVPVSPSPSSITLSSPR